MRWLPRSTLPSAASRISLNYKRFDEDTEILSYALFKEKGTQLPIVQVLLDK